MNGDLMNADEAMKRLGVSEEELRQLVADGVLEEHASGGETAYAAEDVERLAGVREGGARAAPQGTMAGGGVVPFEGRDPQKTIEQPPAPPPAGQKTVVERDVAVPDSDPLRTLADDLSGKPPGQMTVEYGVKLPGESPEAQPPADGQQTIRQEPRVPDAEVVSNSADVTIADSDPDMTLEFDSRSSTRRGGLSTDAQMTIMNVWNATIQTVEEPDPECTLKAPDQDFRDSQLTLEDTSRLLADSERTLEDYPTPPTIGQGPRSTSFRDGSATESRLDLMVSGLPRSEVTDLTATVAGMMESREEGGTEEERLADFIATSGAEFSIVRHLASGGMGDVFMAHQAGLDRIVAFKVPKLVEGRDARRDLALFVREAAVTGELEHPNIVPIYKSGASTDNTPFYAMKKVNGVEWRFLLNPKLLDPTKDPKGYLEIVERSKSLDLNDQIEILIKVCDAMAFAHSRGIVHRDLKPENVMVGEYGEVLVMDWGLAVDVSDRDPMEAKAAHVSTIKGSAGTPAYLAPEMALPDLGPIGKHSDIYLLGAILYELLTGTPPHRGGSLIEVIYAAAENNIQRLEERAPDRDIPEGLSDITLKAMSSDPKDRYESAEAFQAAIREYQGHAQSLEISSAADEELQELAAADQSRGSELYARYAAVIASYKQALRLWEENRHARSGLVRATESFVEAALANKDLGLAEAQIGQLREAEGHNELRVSQFEKDLSLLAAAEARTKRNLRIMQFTAAALVFVLIGGGIAFSIWQKAAADNAKRLATEASDQRDIAETQRAAAVKAEADAVKQRDIADEQRKKAEDAKQKIAKQKDEIAKQKDFAEKQRELAEERRKAAVAAETEAKDQKRRAEDQKKLADHAAARAKRSLAQVYINRAQARLEAERDYGEAALRLVQALEHYEDSDVAREMLARVMQIAPRIEGYRSVKGGSRLVAFSTDGKALAVISGDGRFQALAVPSLAPRGGDVDLGARPWQAVPLSGDAWLVSLEDSRVLRVAVKPGAEAEVSELARPFDVQATALAARADGPEDGLAIAVGSSDGRVALFGADGARVKYRAHTSGVSALKFAGAQRLVSAGWDGSIKHWRLRGSRREAEVEGAAAVPTMAAPDLLFALKGHGEFVYGLDVTPDGLTAVSSGADGTIRLWDLERGIATRTLKAHEGAVGAVAFIGDGKRRFASQGWDGTVRLWDRASNEVTATLRVTAKEFLCLAVDPRGERLACVARSGGFKVWDVRSRMDVATHGDLAERKAKRAGLSPDGAQLLIYTDAGGLSWVEAASGKVTAKATARAGALAIRAVADGSVLAVLANGQISHCRSGQEPAVGRRLSRAPQLAEVDVGGRRIAIAWKGGLAVYDAEDGKELASRELEAGKWTALDISPDGAACAGIRESGGVVVVDKAGSWSFDVPAGVGLRVLCLGPEGHRVALGGDDRVIRVYERGDNDTGRLVASMQGHEGVIEALAVTADGQTLISGARDRSVKLWDMASLSSWLSLPIAEGWVSELVISADGSRFGALSERGVLRIWTMPRRGEKQDPARLMDAVKRHFALELLNGQPCTTTGSPPAAGLEPDEDPGTDAPIMGMANE